MCVKKVQKVFFRHGMLYKDIFAIWFFSFWLYVYVCVNVEHRMVGRRRKKGKSRRFIEKRGTTSGEKSYKGSTLNGQEDPFGK